MNTQIEFDEDLSCFGIDEYFYRKTANKIKYSNVFHYREKNLIHYPSRIRYLKLTKNIYIEHYGSHWADFQ
jgi:hypothetical protein